MFEIDDTITENEFYINLKSPTTNFLFLPCLSPLLGDVKNAKEAWVFFPLHNLKNNYFHKKKLFFFYTEHIGFEMLMYPVISEKSLPIDSIP